MMTMHFSGGTGREIGITILSCYERRGIRSFLFSVFSVEVFLYFENRHLLLSEQKEMAQFFFASLWNQ